MASCGCGTSKLSVCGKYSAQVTCDICAVQGADYDITIFLKDIDGQLLDLDRFNLIEVFLFDINDNFISKFSNDSSTDNNTLVILQTIDTDSTDNAIVNKGEILLELSAALTSTIQYGNIYVEIRLKESNSNYTGNEKTSIISCFKIGKIISSKIIKTELDSEE